MKVVIPYREISMRCKDKNIRNFHNNKSILDISIEYFLNIGCDIVLACVPSDTSVKRAKKYKLQTIDLLKEDNGWPNLIREIGSKVDAKKDEPILFWLATDVTMLINNNFKDIINENAQLIPEHFDSIVFGTPFLNYLVDENCYPQNFSAGPWHPYSQNLQKRYQISASAITTKRCMVDYMYSWGPNSKLTRVDMPIIDINDEKEFKLAQLVWRHWND